jgi:hypothetical protein
MRAIEGAGGSNWGYYKVDHEPNHGEHYHCAKRYRGDGQVGPQVGTNHLMFH